MKYHCINRLTSLSTLFSLALAWLALAEPAGTAAAIQATPLEQALARWKQGDKGGAVEQFLNIDWKATPVVSPNSPLAKKEKDLPTMSESARQKLMQEVMPWLQDLKQLAGAVRDKASSEEPKNPTAARAYLAKIAECGAALDKPEALRIVQLTAQALRKMATGNQKPKTAPTGN
jgi:hypothetical protein